MSALGNKQVMAYNIKRYMDSMGISRREFCQRLGFAYSTVTDWLNAEKYHRIDILVVASLEFAAVPASLVTMRVSCI